MTYDLWHSEYCSSLLTMLDEMWCVLPMTPFYEISNFGRLRQAGTKRQLRPWVHKSGHLYVRLKGGLETPQVAQIHRLVLIAFVGPPALKQEALHGDGNPANNRLENLRWGTRLDNIHDCIRHSRKSPRAKLTIEQIDVIRAGLVYRGYQTDMAERYGVSITCINRIMLNRTYMTGIQ